MTTEWPATADALLAVLPLGKAGGLVGGDRADPLGRVRAQL